MLNNVTVFYDDSAQFHLLDEEIWWISEAMFFCDESFPLFLVSMLDALWLLWG